MPTMDASSQSAGAVNMEVSSPKPATFIARGAPCTVSTSASTMSGQRDGVVRLTPLRSRTETSSVKPSTEAAVCTTTSGTPTAAEATLPMSVIVPPPMRHHGVDPVRLLAGDLRSPARRRAARDVRRPGRSRAPCSAAPRWRAMTGLIGTEFRRMGVRSIISPTTGRVPLPAAVAEHLGRLLRRPPTSRRFRSAPTAGHSGAAHLPGSATANTCCAAATGSSVDRQAGADPDAAARRRARGFGMVTVNSSMSGESGVAGGLDRQPRPGRRRRVRRPGAQPAGGPPIR